MQDCKTSVSQGVTKAVSESKNLETGMWEENKPDLQGRTVLRGLMPSLDYTPVKIVVYFRDCDYHCLALVDTGCGMSCVSLDLVKKLGVQLNINADVAQVFVKTASGNLLRSHGLLLLPFSFGGRTIHHVFRVVEGLHDNMYLGNDFLDLHQLDVSVSSRCLKSTTPNSTFTCPISVTTAEIERVKYEVRANRTVTIAGMSFSCVPIHKRFTSSSSVSSASTSSSTSSSGLSPSASISSPFSESSSSSHSRIQPAPAHQPQLKRTLSSEEFCLADKKCRLMGGNVRVRQIRRFNHQFPDTYEPYLSSSPRLATFSASALHTSPHPPLSTPSPTNTIDPSLDPDLNQPQPMDMAD